MLNWLLRRFASEGVFHRLTQLENNIKRVESSQNLFEATLLDDIIAKTEKLEKRMATRYARSIKEPEDAVALSSGSTPMYYKGYKVKGGRLPS